MERSIDQDGRVKTLTLGPNVAAYGDLSQVFGYDNVSRLVAANLAAGQTQSYTYDANGNRSNATIGAGSTTYTYPSGSHKLGSLSGTTTRSFSYDNTGSVTSTAGVAYAYDGRGRLKQAGTTTYLLNALGQRVKKSSGSDVFFAYDGAGHLIGEYDSSGAVTQETIWLNNTPVAVIKPKTTSGFDIFYIWADHLGTPRLISDAMNEIRWEWAHSDPFGNNLPNENPGGIGNFTYNLRSPGQYYDVETGNHYNYFRDYDPKLGRFIQSDPIGLRGGVNTYGYVGGNPLSFSDAFGLFATCDRNGDAVSIKIPITFSGDGANPETVQNMINAIQNNWSGPDFSVTVTNGPENQVRVDTGNGRSEVTGGNRGIWGGDNDPWVAGHEAGHLMNLPDLYTDIGGVSFANPGAEGRSVMAAFGAAVTDEDRALARNACGCPK
jgi:RHS repeat-associated protein